MTKSDLLAKMKLLNLPKDSYDVFGSGPMAALGIREVNDIDLYVTPEVREMLLKKGWKELVKGPGDTPVVHDVYEAHDNWAFSPYSPTLNDLLSCAFEVEGICFASIQDVRRWKDESGGPKNIADVERIDRYLRK